MASFYWHNINYICRQTEKYEAQIIIRSNTRPLGMKRNKKHWAEQRGILFTFWKPESASERESKAGYMCWVLVLADTRRDNCVKYHIQTSTNCFFISFDKPVKTPTVSIDKALTESGSQFLDSLHSDQTHISNFTGIKALNIFSCVTVKNCLENISLEFRNLQR